VVWLFFSRDVWQPCTGNMIEREVTRQLSVGVTPVLYLIFLLKYLYKVVCRNFSTPCYVHFEKQTSVYT